MLTRLPWKISSVESSQIRCRSRRSSGIRKDGKLVPIVVLATASIHKFPECVIKSGIDKYEVSFIEYGKWNVMSLALALVVVGYCE